MFKRISAIVMVAVMSAMLSMTAFADVDREAVEKRFVEYYFEVLACDDSGYHIPVEDNPSSSLYYGYYIKPFIEESSEERLENLDLSDETDQSISRFVKFWYLDWESEQPVMIDGLMNDGKSYTFVGEEEDKWILRDFDDNEVIVDIEKTDTSFIFSTDGKKLGEYERLFKYAYLNDEEAIAYDKDLKDGKIDKYAIDYSSDEDVEEVYEEEDSEVDTNQRAVTPELVSEVDSLESAQEEIAVEEPADNMSTNVEDAPKKSNAPVVIGIVLAAAAAISAYFFKKRKDK